MVLTESIIRHGSTHLNGYSFPEKIREVSSTGPPPLTPPPASRHTYQLGSINGNVVYLFANGSSVLSIPFVLMFNALGLHAANADGTLNGVDELLMMRTEAALLMALLACVIFRAGLILLDPVTSIVLALGFAFGTQMFSVATRTLWSHTWFIFLGGLVVYQLVLAESKGQKVSGAALATALSLMYFVPPTGIIPIACISVYVMLWQRRSLLSFAITGALWLAVFMTYWWRTFGTILPGYYRSNVDLSSLTMGLEANLISPSRGLLRLRADDDFYRLPGRAVLGTDSNTGGGKDFNRNHCAATGCRIRLSLLVGRALLRCASDDRFDSFFCAACDCRIGCRKKRPGGFQRNAGSGWDASVDPVDCDKCEGRDVAAHTILERRS